MKFEIYKLLLDKNMMHYEFTSEGPNGKITKLVEYSALSGKNTYNLGFGDKDHETGKMNDMIITNNGDSKKVLATVGSTVYIFTDKYPDAMIYATGSTAVQTRLYRMGITNNLPQVLQDFIIYGFRNGTWEIYEKNIEYGRFLSKELINLLYERKKEK